MRSHPGFGQRVAWPHLKRYLRGQKMHLWCKRGAPHPREAGVMPAQGLLPPGMVGIMYQRENKNRNFDISEQLIALIALVVKMNIQFKKIL